MTNKVGTIVVAAVFLIGLVVAFSLKQDGVGFAAGFNHLWTATQYKYWTLAATFLSLGGLAYVYIVVANKEIQDESMHLPTILVFVLMFILWFGVPATMGSQTTPEHAAQNKWGW